MKILALEASGDACSCALALGDTVTERHEVAPRRHTELILPMVEDLLGGAGVALRDLDRLAYGAGPGSFTGVRIAASVAQGLALAAGLPVTPVSSLAALAARGARAGEAVLACLDARMGQVYLGAFHIAGDGTPQPLEEERLADPDAVEMPSRGEWVALGPGWRAHGETLARRLGGRLVRRDETLLAGAAEIARLARAAPPTPASEAVPGYLRRDVATPRPLSATGEEQHS